MKVDYLIVGQGLAGSLLSWSLLERNKRILVVDRDEEVTSSKVAAGLVTPLAGSKLKMTPAFEERLQFAKRFYWNQEETTGERFFYHLPIQKLFRDKEEAENWNSRNEEEKEAAKNYSAPLTLPDGLLHHPFGGFEMRGGGWLNVPVFLEATRQHLLERAAYAIGNVKSEEVSTTENEIRWRKVEAGKIIFAEGWRADQNRFFDWLTMKNALGDILDVSIPSLAPLDTIVNRGGWLLPLGGDRFRTGSNYRQGETLPRPDERGREEISGKLETITPHAYEVVRHECAIRPIIRRSQIFCGVHPGFERVAFFNGLGSKGVVNGPWYADRFIAHLEERDLLPEEADIRGNLL
ncbi:MAG: FAD-dependent oxidoreductase [Verrucomicrobiota bacterium]